MTPVDDKPLTLMVVHAHPDDESSSTGGILARYADEGVATVVVTCTNGEYGDAPGGIKPGQEGHDPDEVARIRLGELRTACRLLGVAHLELLGYRDSGMPEWDYRHAGQAFCNVPVDVAATQLGELLERYQPDVVVTYDESPGYDHPDHRHAHAVTLAALDATGVGSKVYLITHRHSRFVELRKAMQERGAPVEDWPDPDPDVLAAMVAAEEAVTTVVDVGDVVDRKAEALRAHASQLDEGWWQMLTPEVFSLLFGEEAFRRWRDTTGAPVPEDDLLSGLRVR